MTGTAGPDHPDHPELPDYDARRAWDAIYARSTGLPDEPDDATRRCVATLHDLAGDGPALELAVGDGRVAIPLAESGVAVDGIDIAPNAIELVTANPRTPKDSTFVVGDISDFALERTYSLVYLVFNSIMNLTTQDLQVACFERAAQHLEPGGRFVIENVVPALRRLPPGALGVPFAVTEDYIAIDDFIDRTHHQISRSRHLWRRPDGAFQESTAPFRYVWPAELDLMARIAGLELEDRWADWDRSPFTGESESAVSVWRRP